jgi:hypothetical protein
MAVVLYTFDPTIDTFVGDKYATVQSEGGLEKMGKKDTQMGKSSEPCA